MWNSVALAPVFGATSRTVLDKSYGAPRISEGSPDKFSDGGMRCSNRPL